MAARFFGFRCVVGVVLAFAHALYALFYFTHTGQVFIELAFVGRLILGQILGAVFHAVENADVVQAATIVKQVVPGERGIDFDGTGESGLCQERWEL